MKKILLINLLAFSALFGSAQDNNLAPDQNPNYRISQEKYQAAQQALQTTMNTTVQQTYKAYDWYQARQERKQQRIQFRQQRALARIQNNGYFGNGYFYPYGRYNNYRNGWSGWCY